jgi:hypothetical protein
MEVLEVLVLHQALLAQVLPVLAVVVVVAHLVEVRAVRAVVVLAHNIQLAVQRLVQQTLVAVVAVVLIAHNQRRLAGLVW